MKINTKTLNTQRSQRNKKRDGIKNFVFFVTSCLNFCSAYLLSRGKKMAKGILHFGDKGYGSDHLLKAQKNYVCKLCNRDIHKEELYARHSPNKFKVPLTPVCRDCAWWLIIGTNT
jgi:hypothetical protein